MADLNADDLGFAPPPFDAEAALLQIERSLRDLKLTERGHAFELRGKRVLELTVEGPAIEARVARRPANTPEWDLQTVASTLGQRKLLDEVKKRLARWAQED